MEELTVSAKGAFCQSLFTFDAHVRSLRRCVSLIPCGRVCAQEAEARAAGLLDEMEARCEA
jgi:hypothetical protein